MYRYAILLIVTSLLAACNNAEQPVKEHQPVHRVPDTNTSAGTVADLTPADGCNFSMRQIKYAGSGNFVAVAGLKLCVTEPTVFQEVSLYKKDEPIDNQGEAVYTTEDTASHISIGWTGDTLIINHFAPVPLQEPQYSVKKGVVQRLTLGQKSL